MVGKSLILKIFDASYMQRWNDKLRPFEFIELDKQAHKMCIAWFIGKFEEQRIDYNWAEVIEGGIFDLLQRIVITDIKPPVFYKIKTDAEKYRKLNDFVYKQLEPYIKPLGESFCCRFRDHFARGDDTIGRRVLAASHLYASKWEFDMIERLNPDGFEIKEIKKDFLDKLELYNDLEGMKIIATKNSYRNFIDLCGHLRFQSRWAHVHRIPKTSVLGHSLFVAILSYLFSLEICACRQRCQNNYFTGLFHDLPEVLTRDIVSPVKRDVEGLGDLIKDYEKEQMQKTVYPLLPPGFIDDIKLYAENEFEDVAKVMGIYEIVTGEAINDEYNWDEFYARDGGLVKTMDDLSAYIEARIALDNGCRSVEFDRAIKNITAKYEKKRVSGLEAGAIFAQFKD